MRAIIVIVDPSVSEFEGMMQRFKVTAIGMIVCGTWDIDSVHLGWIVICPFRCWCILARI